MVKYFIIFFLFINVPILKAQNQKDTNPLVAAYDRLLDSKYALFAHKGTYLLPVSYNATPYQENYNKLTNTTEGRSKGHFNKNLETEFQISFLLPIYRKVAKSDWDIIFAYTHHSWWQIYNNQWSRPFRETNYNPELFGRKILHTPVKISKFEMIGFDAGYMHHSNGQVQELSRSWNRLFLRSILRHEHFFTSTSLWYRFPETHTQDDNPTITKYMGIGEIEIYKNLSKHTFGFKTPIAWDYYSFEFKYSYSLKDQWRLYATGRTGYGHSLIDYNQETQRIGLGLILEDFMDR